MSDDVRFRSLGEKEQRSEWEGRLRELQMEIQEREQRNKEAEQKRLQDEERKRIENQKRAGNPFKCIYQIKIIQTQVQIQFALETRDKRTRQDLLVLKNQCWTENVHVLGPDLITQVRKHIFTK